MIVSKYMIFNQNIRHDRILILKTKHENLDSFYKNNPTFQVFQLNVDEYSFDRYANYQ